MVTVRPLPPSPHLVTFDLPLLVLRRAPGGVAAPVAVQGGPGAGGRQGAGPLARLPGRGGVGARHGAGGRPGPHGGAGGGEGVGGEGAQRGGVLVRVAGGRPVTALLGAVLLGVAVGVHDGGTISLDNERSSLLLVSVTVEPSAWITRGFSTVSLHDGGTVSLDNERVLYC